MERGAGGGEAKSSANGCILFTQGRTVVPDIQVDRVVSISTLYTYIYTAASDGKLKTEASAFSLNLLPFAHCTNGSLLFVRMLTKKQIKVIVRDSARFKNKLMGVMVYF